MLAGYPMKDVSSSVTDGSYHEVDSSEMAFKIAASIGFKDVVQTADLALLEPVMRVEVVVPETTWATSSAISAPGAGRSSAWKSRAGAQIIQAMIPLAEMFGYATDLRSITQGRGNYTMHFARYEEARGTISEEVIARLPAARPP